MERFAGRLVHSMREPNAFSNTSRSPSADLTSKIALATCRYSFYIRSRHLTGANSPLTTLCTAVTGLVRARLRVNLNEINDVTQLRSRAIFSFPSEVQKHGSATISPTSDRRAALTWARGAATILPTLPPAAMAPWAWPYIRPFAEECGRLYRPRRRRSNRPGISQAPGTAKAMTVWKAK